MARILLTGISPLAEQVHGWLRHWGHRVTYAASEAALQGAGSLRHADAIIVTCDQHGVDGLCPAALAARGDAAPVILVGWAVRACRRADLYQERVPEPGRGGRRLRRALGYCLQRAELTRRHIDDLKIHHDYVQFLGHELRTPIQSALAALEILAATHAADPEAARRDGDFVRLALRNLKRLGETLEWTEDYLDARTAALAARWREGCLGEFVTQAVDLDSPRPEFSLVFEAGVESMTMVSDTHLLRGLLQQVWRALRYHAPGAHVTLRVSAQTGADEAAPWRSAGPDGATEIVIALHVDWPASGHSPARISRTSLVERGESPQQELTRLVNFTISREVLALFGARLTIPVATEGGPVLRVLLPAVPPGAALALSCASRSAVCP